MENQTPQQSTVNSEPSTVNTVVPSTVHGSPSTFLVVLLSVLLLLAVSVAGFFAYQTQKLVAEVTGYREQLKQTLEPSPTPDPTADLSRDEDLRDWKTYTNNEFGFQMKYPPAWKLEVDKNIATNGNREFRFKTEKNEYISGVIFDGPTGYIQELEDWEKKLNTRNGDLLFISYTDNIGPGSKGGTIDLEIFNVFASTFKFID